LDPVTNGLTRSGSDRDVVEFLWRESETPRKIDDGPPGRPDRNGISQKPDATAPATGAPFGRAFPSAFDAENGYT
jgi:hypothetical protein